MVLHGIHAIDTMRKTGSMLEMCRARAELLLSDICMYVSILLLQPISLTHTVKKYYNRWANHEQSAKLSLDLYSKTEKKMEEMQITSALTWIEVQFMKKAVEEVDKCRTTLKWTYAMAYYLAKGNEKDLFEDNQRSVFFFSFYGSLLINFYRDLEKAVEDLSELLESPIEADNIPTLRQQVTNKTVCLIHLSSLYHLD